MNTEAITNFLFELASLRRVTRTHRQYIPDAADDNIADHSFRVAMIGLILAELEGVNRHTVLKMCLFHDIAEARTGDANYLNQQYGELREDEVVRDQMEQLPIRDEVLAIVTEYEARQTPESHVAKDADLLDQMVLQQEYFRNDPENHEIWHNHAQKSLTTASARALAQEIRQTNPFRWLYVAAGKKTNTVVGARPAS